MSHERTCGECVLEDGSGATCCTCDFSQRPAAAGAIDALQGALAFAVRDWSANRRDAWIWGIIWSWDDGEAMDDVAEKHGWSNRTIKKLRRYHRGIRALMEHRSGDEGIE